MPISRRMDKEAVVHIPSTFKPRSLTLAGTPYEFFPEVYLGCWNLLSPDIKRKKFDPSLRVPHSSSSREPHLSSHIVAADLWAYCNNSWLYDFAHMVPNRNVLPTCPVDQTHIYPWELNSDFFFCNFCALLSHKRIHIFSVNLCYQCFFSQLPICASC